jgi:DNA-directed RNA polymerase subunit L
MDVEIIEKSADTIKIRIEGGSQSVFPLIVDAALKNNGVSFAGYSLDHPLKRASILILKTKNGKDPAKVLQEVIDQVKEELEEARKAINDAFE